MNNKALNLLISLLLLFAVGCGTPKDKKDVAYIFDFNEYVSIENFGKREGKLIQDSGYIAFDKGMKYILLKNKSQDVATSFFIQTYVGQEMSGQFVTQESSTYDEVRFVVNRTFDNSIFEVSILPSDTLLPILEFICRKRN